MPDPDMYPVMISTGGRRFWRFGDGVLLPVVSGGADDGDDGDASGDDENQDDDKLRAEGKKALDEERTAKKAAEKAARAEKKRADDLQRQIDELKAGTSGDTDKAVEDATRAAREEALAAANRRILVAEIKAAAGGKLSDPADAVRLIDLDEFEPDDDGEFDAKAIAGAIEQLLKDKPYLGAVDPKGGKPKGSADGGARSGKEKDDVSPGAGRLRRAYASSK